MSNEQLFHGLCENMANIEDIITTLDNIGLLVEPDEGIGLRLYSTASSLYRLASELLIYPDVTTENDVANELFAAKSENVKEIAQKIWSQYGTK